MWRLNRLTNILCQFTVCRVLHDVLLSGALSRVPLYFGHRDTQGPGEPGTLMTRSRGLNHCSLHWFCILERVVCRRGLPLPTRPKRWQGTITHTCMVSCSAIMLMMTCPATKAHCALTQVCHPSPFLIAVTYMRSMLATVSMMKCTGLQGGVQTSGEA